MSLTRNLQREQIATGAFSTGLGRGGCFFFIREWARTPECSQTFDVPLYVSQMLAAWA